MIEVPGYLAQQLEKEAAEKEKERLKKLREAKKKIIIDVVPTGNMHD